MIVFNFILLTVLIGCALSVSFIKNLYGAVIIFAAYSLIMAVVWQQLGSPDVAITEAAVGAGVTTLLFFATLKRIDGGKGN